MAPLQIGLDCPPSIHRLKVKLTIRPGENHWFLVMGRIKYPHLFIFTVITSFCKVSSRGIIEGRWYNEAAAAKVGKQDSLPRGRKFDDD